MDNAVSRVSAGKTDVTGVTRGREQTGGELGGKVRRGAWSGGGFVGRSEPDGCVQVVAVALLGKVALGFEWETGAAVALVPVKETHGRGEAVAFSGRLRGASEIDAGAGT